MFHRNPKSRIEKFLFKLAPERTNLTRAQKIEAAKKQNQTVFTISREQAIEALASEIPNFSKNQKDKNNHLISTRKPKHVLVVNHDITKIRIIYGRKQMALAELCFMLGNGEVAWMKYCETHKITSTCKAENCLNPQHLGLLLRDRNEVQEKVNDEDTLSLLKVLEIKPDQQLV
jgi:hypothetical protein